MSKINAGNLDMVSQIRHNNKHVVPLWVHDVILEGVIKNGVKPVLYTSYSDYSMDTPLIPHYSKLGINMYCGASITIRNILFCHTNDILKTSDPLPKDIPNSVLDKYKEIDRKTLLMKELEKYCSEDDEIWDLARHHNDDPSLWIHAHTLVENCEFVCNGIGALVICVSSINYQSAITHSLFDKNFIGVTSLEKEHLVEHNEFRNNYLTGIALDKGSRSICRENLFVGNGHMGIIEPNNPMNDFRSAILSCFCITSSVPKIQTPLIFNNTFVNNERALVVVEPEYRSQYMNRPFFFNNIISDSKPCVLFVGDSVRCHAIGAANCFDSQSYKDVVSSDQDWLTSLDMHKSPGFSDEFSYTLEKESPCIDAGMFVLNPGVMSEKNYSDYGQMDIGFHQLPGTGVHLLAPINLRIEENMGEEEMRLLWEKNGPPFPHGYLVRVETVYGDNVQAIYCEETNFNFYNLALDYDHLYFWVFSHLNRWVYSDPVMIEWMK